MSKLRLGVAGKEYFVGNNDVVWDGLWAGRPRPYEADFNKNAGGADGGFVEADAPMALTFTHKWESSMALICYITAY